MSREDLEALKARDLSSMSKEGLQLLKDDQDLVARIQSERDGAKPEATRPEPEAAPEGERPADPAAYAARSEHSMMGTSEADTFAAANFNQIPFAARLGQLSNNMMAKIQPDKYKSKTIEEVKEGLGSFGEGAETGMEKFFNAAGTATGSVVGMEAGGALAGVAGKLANAASKANVTGKLAKYVSKIPWVGKIAATPFGAGAAGHTVGSTMAENRQLRHKYGEDAPQGNPAMAAAGTLAFMRGLGMVNQVAVDLIPQQAYNKLGEKALTRMATAGASGIATWLAGKASGKHWEENLADTILWSTVGAIHPARVNKKGEGIKGTAYRMQEAMMDGLSSMGLKVNKKAVRQGTKGVGREQRKFTNATYRIYEMKDKLIYRDDQGGVIGKGLPRDMVQYLDALNQIVSIKAGEMSKIEAAGGVRKLKSSDAIKAIQQAIDVKVNGEYPVKEAMKREPAFAKEVNRLIDVLSEQGDMSSGFVDRHLKAANQVIGKYYTDIKSNNKVDAVKLVANALRSRYKTHLDSYDSGAGKEWQGLRNEMGEMLATRTAIEPHARRDAKVMQRPSLMDNLATPYHLGFSALHAMHGNAPAAFMHAVPALAKWHTGKYKTPTKAMNRMWKRMSGAEASLTLNERMTKLTARFTGETAKVIKEATGSDTKSDVINQLLKYTPEQRFQMLKDITERGDPIRVTQAIQDAVAEQLLGRKPLQITMQDAQKIRAGMLGEGFVVGEGTEPMRPSEPGRKLSTTTGSKLQDSIMSKNVDSRLAQALGEVQPGNKLASEPKRLTTDKIAGEGFVMEKRKSVPRRKIDGEWFEGYDEITQSDLKATQDKITGLEIAKEMERKAEHEKGKGFLAELWKDVQKFNQSLGKSGSVINESLGEKKKDYDVVAETKRNRTEKINGKVLPKSKRIDLVDEFGAFQHKFSIDMDSGKIYPAKQGRHFPGVPPNRWHRVVRVIMGVGGGEKVFGTRSGAFNEKIEAKWGDGLITKEQALKNSSKIEREAAQIFAKQYPGWKHLEGVGEFIDLRTETLTPTNPIPGGGGKIADLAKPIMSSNMPPTVVDVGKEKFMAWGADWLGVNSSGAQSPEGQRYIEGSKTWAVRENAAGWIRNQLAKGINKVVIVSNKSSSGLKSNPMFVEFVKNNIIKTHPQGKKIVAAAEKAEKVKYKAAEEVANKKVMRAKMKVDRAQTKLAKAAAQTELKKARLSVGYKEQQGYREMAAAIKAAKGKSIQEYLTLASESEGYEYQDKAVYTAEVKSLENDGGHPYPVKVYLDNVQEFGKKPSFSSMAAEMGIDKQAHLRLRSNNIVLDEKSPSFKDSLKTRQPVDEFMEKRTVGITPAAEKVPEIKALLDRAKDLSSSGQFKAAAAVRKEVLAKGQKELSNLFNDVPGVKIKVQQTLGDYYGEEPTLHTEVAYPKKSEGEVLRRISKQGESWSQDTVHVSKKIDIVPESAILGKEFADGYSFEPEILIKFNRSVSPEEFVRFNDLLRSKGLAGSTLLPNKKGIYAYNVSRGNYGKKPQQFIKEAQGVFDILHGKGLEGGRSGSQEALRAVDYDLSHRKLLVLGNKDSGATRTYEQVRDYVSPIEKPREERKTFSMADF